MTMTKGRSRGFARPPVTHTTDGRVRRAGFEFEYGGRDIKTSARIVGDVFGGEHIVRSTFEHIVRGELGDFSVEIDAALLKDKRYEKPLRAIGIDPERTNTEWLENALLDTFSTLVPIEIGTPPIPIDQEPCNLASLWPLVRCTRRMPLVPGCTGLPGAGALPSGSVGRQRTTQ